MSVTDPTDAELLVKVKLALAGTLDRNASQIVIAGRTLGSLDISDLIALRKHLEGRINRAARTSASAVVEFREPA